MWYVYKHVRKDTGCVCYYGCGKERRPWDVRKKGSEHEMLRRKGMLRVIVIGEFNNHEDALRKEEYLVDRAKSRGCVLFNVVSGGCKGMREHAMQTYTAGIGVHAMSKEQRRRIGKKVGDVVGHYKWWIHPTTKHVMRSLTHPVGYVKYAGNAPRAHKVVRGSFWWINLQTKERKRAHEQPVGFVRGFQYALA